MKRLEISMLIDKQIFDPNFFNSFFNFFLRKIFFNFTLYDCNLNFYIIEI